ncbi:Uncharacterised protein [uncultured Roseburia sp.]|uniref:DUF5716 family protein n=1 Tax=Brotonthovivens ammoniilytica TaxID=2981725 RepID=A0ABT2TIK9_9FIRM|nr:DUF5716 family protein [Brotonthovivens ammoniilytica]MCU6761506.1 DUF5716 family protein [Brotonthovivens ammoniilytica]SCI30409.1 Uncharacterised protein [uncultured Roseburia sp.]
MKEVTIHRKKIYMGLDLGYDNAMVSFLKEEGGDPFTVSTRSDRECYQIPVSLYEGKNGYYLYGAEAQKRRQDQNGILYEQLYLRAIDLIHTDGAGEAVERLALFVSRLVRLKDKLCQDAEYEICLSIAVPKLTPKAAEVFALLREMLKETAETMFFMDYGESFFYYTYHQEKSIWAHDVAMFDFSDRQVRFTLLARESRTVPQIVVSGEKVWEVPALAEDDGQEKDVFFASILREAFAKRIISGVYLLGDGFDGNWLCDTLRVLGPNRRVFVGKNLYTKGAAYAGSILSRQGDWPYSYDCSYKVQANVSLKASVNGTQKFLPVVTAGENWFEVKKQFDVILKGTPSVDIWIQERGERNAKIEPLLLENVWKRPERTRKIRISVRMINQQKLYVTILDLGFGAFYPSTEKQWKFEIDLY